TGTSPGRSVAGGETGTAGCGTAAGRSRQDPAAGGEGPSGGGPGSAGSRGEARGEGQEEGVSWSHGPRHAPDHSYSGRWSSPTSRSTLARCVVPLGPAPAAVRAVFRLDEHHARDGRSSSAGASPALPCWGVRSRAAACPTDDGRAGRGPGGVGGSGPTP